MHFWRGKGVCGLAVRREACAKTGTNVTYHDNEAVIGKGSVTLGLLCVRGDTHIVRPRVGTQIFARQNGTLSRALRESMEMRTDIRYRLDAPAVFSWEGVGHKHFQGEGITRDVSVQGAFILTATLPPPDCSIHVDLLLPSIAGVKSIMRITGRARVVRVEHSSADSWMHGFAVVTDDRNQWDLLPMQTESQPALVAAGRAH